MAKFRFSTIIEAEDEDDARIEILDLDCHDVYWEVEKIEDEENDEAED